MSNRQPLFFVLRERPIAVLLTTGLATIGGAAAFRMNWPLAWMLGAMSAVMIFALAGARVVMDPHFRLIMIAIIGVMIGSSFTPAVLQGVVTWAPTLLGLGGYVAIGTLASGLYLTQIGGLDRRTAFFAAFPGGLTQMTIIGGAIGADERAISINHAVRIVLVVAAIPLFFKIGLGLQRPALAMSTLADLKLVDGSIMLACAVAGGTLGYVLRNSLMYMLGPMIVSAAIHLSGITAARPPDELTAAAQIILGAAIGCRFAGSKLGMMMRTTMHGLIAAAILLAVTAAFVMLLDPFTSVGIESLILAYAPGGLTEMGLIGLALGLDIAFISTHHIVRIVLIMLVGPIFGRLFALWSRPKPGDGL